MAGVLQKEQLQNTACGTTKGYLLKKKKGRLFTSWKRRWFVLQDNKLLYFVSDDESKLKGSVDVACLSLHRGNADEEDAERRCCFALVEWNLGWLDGVESTDVPNRAYLMSAETDEQVDVWFNAIARAKTQHRRAKRKQLETHRVMSAHDLLGLEGVARLAEDYKLQLQRALPQPGQRLGPSHSRLSSVFMPTTEDDSGGEECAGNGLPAKPLQADDLEEAFMRDFLGVTDDAATSTGCGERTIRRSIPTPHEAELGVDAPEAHPLECTQVPVEEVIEEEAFQLDAGNCGAHIEEKGALETVSMAASVCPAPPLEPAPPPPECAVIPALAAVAQDTHPISDIPQDERGLLESPSSPSSFKTASVSTSMRRTRLLGQRNSFNQRCDHTPSLAAEDMDAARCGSNSQQVAGGEESLAGQDSNSAQVEPLATTPVKEEALSCEVIETPAEASNDEPVPQSKMDMLRMVAHEFLSTEKAYLRDLSKLQRIYIKPLLAESFVTKEQHKAIFSNTEELMDVSARLLGALRANVDLEGPTGNYRIGAAFVQEIHGMTAFISYCTAQNASLSTLASLCRTTPAFVRWMDATDAEQPGQLGLNSFLVKPLQRLCKYPLLFRELLQHMPEDHPDRPTVMKADHGLAQLLYRANETKRMEDNRSAVVALDVELKWPQELSRRLESPDRLLLRKETARACVGSQKPAKSVIILMSDLLIVAKEKDRYLAVKGLLKLRDSIVWEIKNPKLRHAFSVVRSGSPKVVIMCKTEEEKESWIAEIMDAQTRLQS